MAETELKKHQARAAQIRQRTGKETGTISEDDEQRFAGHPLSFYDQYADEAALTQVDGVGEARAKEIMAARRKRDRAR